VRLAETVRLALPDEVGRCGAAWLAMGALPLAAGEGIAWVEMARGLLVHHVQLEGSGEAARVAACRVVAPTDWNFDPEGAFARLVETLPAHLDAEATRRLDAWTAAFAPCVPLHLAQAHPAEASHA
jgi:coenzyme F420-reducing hydrogenase alpha subunit